MALAVALVVAISLAIAPGKAVASHATDGAYAGGGAWTEAAALTSADNSLVGNWSVTFGNTTVVAISFEEGAYTVTATEPVQVTGSPCYLPPGTVIATFSGAGNSYSGKGGLWNTSNCSFLEWTSLELTLDGNALTASYGSGCASSQNCAKAVFTRSAAVIAPANGAPPEVKITAAPAKETSDQTPVFGFSGVAGGTYECSMDAGPWQSCFSGGSFGPVAPGDHRFGVRETLGGLVGPADSYDWTIDLPRACVLRVARARVFAFTRRGKARLVVRYKAYRPAQVTVSYTLTGTRGSLLLGSASAHFLTAGIFRLPESLSNGERAKLRATSSVKVRFAIRGAPNSCNPYYAKRLTIPRRISGQTVWFQSDSQFAPGAAA